MMRPAGRKLSEAFVLDYLMKIQTELLAGKFPAKSIKPYQI